MTYLAFTIPKKNSMAIFLLVFFTTTKTTTETTILQIFLRIACSQLLHELCHVFNQLFQCHRSNALKESF